MADADRLLEWRNDPDTRANSHRSEVVTRSDHLAWLARSLEDDRRRLWIAEVRGIAVGTMRADRDETEWVLSWTVAPEHRGQGTGRRMLQAVTTILNGPMRAEIKRDNAASIRIATAVGFCFEREIDGVMYWRWPA
jgi:RimJ/RimL family protein N-acetyltransferase